MEVKLWAVSCVVVFTVACSQNKTVNDVYSNSVDDSSCAGSAVEKSYIVEWEDGRFSKVIAEDEEALKSNFINPNLNDLRRVEPDRLVVLNQEQDKPSVDQAGGDFSQLANDYTWGQTITEVSSVWQKGITGSGVKVGVVDAKIDSSHPQLINQVIDGQSFISNDDSSNSLTNEHGTHVSGIIAAADAANVPMKGIAPGAKIIAGSFIGNSGSGSLGDAILAMQYTTEKGARIINASWGGAPCVQSLRSAFDKIQQSGVLIVVAAGNNQVGKDIDLYPEYPAAFNFPGQITVAASTPSDYMASFSNNGFQGVHIAAPGVSILSTVPGNTYEMLDGTSMAAPFVSGAAALLWSARPLASSAQIKSALLKSVDIYPNHQFRVSSRGRLNIRKAYDELVKMLP